MGPISLLLLTLPVLAPVHAGFTRGHQLALSARSCVTGFVVDESGAAAPDQKVLVTGPSGWVIGATADDGSFCLPVQRGDALQLSAIDLDERQIRSSAQSVTAPDETAVCAVGACTDAGVLTLAAPQPAPRNVSALIDRATGPIGGVVRMHPEPTWQIDGPVQVEMADLGPGEAGPVRITVHQSVRSGRGLLQLTEKRYIPESSVQLDAAVEELTIRAQNWFGDPIDDWSDSFVVEGVVQAGAEGLRGQDVTLNVELCQLKHGSASCEDRVLRSAP